MKKIFWLAITLTAFATAWAQNESANVMHINLKDGNTATYNLTEIQDITFEAVTPVQLPASFAAPKASDFSASYVYKVMCGANQVAEADLEYVKGIGQVVVVYPLDSEGKADLAKGITVTGAKIAWNAETKLPEVGEAAGDIAKFYVVDGELLTAYDGETQDATLRADLLVDVRGSETESYRLVKIGLQYWTADNLRATKFTDGTDIAGISQNDADLWNGNTTGAYMLGEDEQWEQIAGRLYNGYCAVSEKIAPTGWRVPSCADYGNIRTSVGARTAKLYKDSSPASWGDGKEGSNDTGFSVIATGYFSTATGLNMMFSDTYIWTSDTQYDALSRANAIDFFRIMSTATNATFPTKGLNPHTYNFGHCIRLVRE